MTRTSRPARAAAALLTITALAAPAASAQDPGPPPPPPTDDDGPLTAKLTAPGTATRAVLRKGLAVRVRCNRDCDARLSLTGAVGILSETSTTVPGRGRRTVVVRVAPLYLDVLKPGQRLTLSLRARTEDGGLAQGRKRIRVR